MKLRTVVLIAVLSALVGSLVPDLILKGVSSEVSASAIGQGCDIEKREVLVGLTSPLLDCAASSKSTQDLKLQEAAWQAISRVDGLREAGAPIVSFYYRNLRDGQWAGLNETAPLKVGSMLKVPLLMAYLKREESEPGFLNSKIGFSSKEKLALYQVQGEQPSKRLELGKSYSLRELLEAIIVYSDNVAASLLENYDQREGLKRLALETDTPIHSSAPPFRPLSLVEYASYFTMLYNATYLDRHSSEEALKLLLRSEYRKGIAAGVPEGIKVAHKFGEAIASAKKGEEGEFHYLSECGIIYLPSNPFLLCVSAFGLGGEGFETYLQSVSKAVFNYHQKITLADGKP